MQYNNELFDGIHDFLTNYNNLIFNAKTVKKVCLNKWMYKANIDLTPLKFVFSREMSHW